MQVYLTLLDLAMMVICVTCYLCARRMTRPKARPSPVTETLIRDFYLAGLITATEAGKQMRAIGIEDAEADGLVALWTTLRAAHRVAVVARADRYVN